MGLVDEDGRKPGGSAPTLAGRSMVAAAVRRSETGPSRRCSRNRPERWTVPVRSRGPSSFGLPVGAVVYDEALFRPSRQALQSSRAVHLSVLALPVRDGRSGDRGLGPHLHVYQDFDESVHYQIVIQAAHLWPRLMVSGYGSWSAPLVYWLLAAFSRPLGVTLVGTRFVVAAMSWASCAVAYVIFRDRLGARPLVALALALMLALSPYFFGESLRVLTDNPTWLFVMLALERLLAYAQQPRTWKLAAFAAFAATATMMRQTSVWLFLPALAIASTLPTPRRSRILGGLVVALGLVPLVWLLYRWGGLLPSGGKQIDPEVYRFRNVLMSLAVVGLWGLFLVPWDELAALPRALGRRGSPPLRRPGSSAWSSSPPAPWTVWTVAIRTASVWSAGWVSPGGEWPAPAWPGGSWCPWAPAR